MRLEVVTPKGPLIQTEVDEVTAPGVLGEFGVLPGHIPFLTGVRTGVLSWRAGDSTGVAAVGAGFAQIAHERIVVLVESGLLADKINVEETKAEFAVAQRKVDAHADDAGVRAELEAQLAWCQARLDAAGITIDGPMHATH